MELVVAKADLQKELQLCQGIVEKRSTIPILSNVLLRARGDALELAATDLDVTLESRIPARVVSEGGVTLEAKRLFDVIRSLPDEEISIVLEENFWVRIECGTARFRLLGLPADDYPTLPAVEAGREFEIDLVDLKTMVERVIFAITHEDTRFQLNGALLKVLEDRIEMVATDGHRMALVNVPQPSGRGTEEMTILVPRKALHELLRFEVAEGGRVRFGTSDNQIFFVVGERRMMARMIDVNFPNYMDVISRDNDRRVLVQRDRLLSTIRRVSLLANERTRAIRFDFAPGALTISSVNPDLGDAREVVPIDYTGETFHVGLNAAYMADFLSAVDTDNVSLDLKDENSQCIGRPLAGSPLPYDYLYVVMPMRI
jgi:DNA polymerase III subunit beta